MGTNPGRKNLMTVQGTEEYARFLDDLQRRRGHATRSEMIESALASYAAEIGITAPQRSKPLGWNRYSDPSE